MLGVVGLLVIMVLLLFDVFIDLDELFIIIFGIFFLDVVINMLNFVCLIVLFGYLIW